MIFFLSGAFVFNLLSEADEEMVFEMVSYFEVSHFYLFIISFVLKRFGMVSRSEVFFWNFLLHFAVVPVFRWAGNLKNIFAGAGF